MGLAEPKRKVRYSLDPNALHWANNDNKIGSKLMEKMGWEKGKGLGAKEDGMTEHIKVRFKSDNKGVGYNNNDYDNVWLDHQDEFESLLSNLAKDGDKKSAQEATTVPSTSVQSLELKSKQSRARLHYKRFARSKDLSSVSENDLGCILGSKSQKRKSEAIESDSQSGFEETRPGLGGSYKTQERATDETPKPKSESNLLFSTNSLSIGDYFAKKMAAKKKSLAGNEDSGQEESQIAIAKAEEESVETTEITETAAIEEEDEQMVKKKKEKRAEKPKDRRLRKLMKKSFKDSNFFEINGYSSYVINMTIEEALKEKQKLIHKKQTQLDKNLEKNPEFYKMNKKLNC